MDITFLHGFNRSDGINQLIAGCGNDIHRYESGTDSWTGLSQPISPTLRGSTTTFLDRVFWVNGEQNNKSFNGISWRDEVTAKKAPLAKYCFAHPTLTRIFFGYLSYNGRTFASRVWYTDLPKNDDITYGLEYGTDLVQYASGQTVLSNTAYFVTRNIKVGDPFIILTGANAGEYRIQSVDNEHQVTLTTALTSAGTSGSFWCGSNFFDVVTNNNDELKGFADNSDQLLVFKRNSLYKYGGTRLRKIKGVPGTTSHQSIASLKEYTYYFHDTGVWRCDGSTSIKISRPVQDYIEGISSSNYDNVVAWVVGDTIRFYVGDVTNTAKGVSVEKCILDFDTVTETWSPGQLPIDITAATVFTENNVENVYLGTDEGGVYLENTGTSDNDEPISWMINTGFHYPGGPEILVEFTRMLIYTQNGRGISVLYKLYGVPGRKELQLTALGDIEDEVTELEFKQSIEDEIVARGIALQLQNSSESRPPIIDRIDIFYKLHIVRHL